MSASDRRKIQSNFSGEIVRISVRARDPRVRATDPVWSLETYAVKSVVKTPDDPILYYLSEGAAKRAFTRQELMLVPEDTRLPPSEFLK